MSETSTPDTRTNENRSTTPHSETFKAYIAGNWAATDETLPPERAQATYAAARRGRLSADYPGVVLVVGAGAAKRRSNDTDYPYRAHSAFAYLTGWGADTEPGSVLLMMPEGDGHTATLYFRERAGRDSDEFYANPEIGEFWIGPRPSLAQVASSLGIATRPLADLGATVAATSVGGPLAVIQETDPDLSLLLEDVRGGLNEGARAAADALDVELARDLSEYRLVKDDYEVSEIRAAIAATASGFDDIVAEFPRLSGHPRGERVVEGIFHARARTEGNAVGYDTIAAAGAHACILHWTRNDGPVHGDDLILVDAGVERDSYYTADITRTLPVSGTFSPRAREVYEAVREAADAAFAIVRPGITFRTIHQTAMAVIAAHTADWGILPVSAEEAVRAENQQHRRYMVHGTSHHLGLDVHDCAAARREMYLDGVLEPGMVFTIEPGLYFQPDDLTVPADFRGIGVRIEDNILVTANGAENLSAAIPRTADAVEEWIRTSTPRER